MISLDSETTGLDLRHGARPFFVTICDEEERVTYWCWDVDPLTRVPEIPETDLQQIADTVFGLVGDDGPDLVLQNGKFDVTALQTVMSPFSWPWDRTYDTLLAGHLLESNRPHDLTSMVLRWCGVDIEQFEKRLEECVKACRRKVQQAKLRVKRTVEKGQIDESDLEALYEDNPLARWRIAEAGLPDIPSAKEETWKADGWLPLAMSRFLGSEAPAEWETVLRDYANTDSAGTLGLWKVQRDEIRRRGLGKIYEERRKVLKIAYEMEARGVTVSGARLCELTREYAEESQKCHDVCTNIAASLGHNLDLPRGGRNKNLETFMFDVLKLPPIRNNPKAKTSAPTLNKAAMEEYRSTLSPGSRAGVFIRNLLEKRQRDTALAYMAGYERFWIHVLQPCARCGGSGFSGAGSGYDDVCDDCGGQRFEGVENWYRLHPSINPTGTDTLRWSSSNPNEQNISKRGIRGSQPCKKCEGAGCKACDETGKGAQNVRYCFGPLPGRHWASFDGQNLELRLPFYKSGEQSLIDLFEHPDDPPYYGSNHLLNFHTIYPDIWAAEEKEVGYEKVGPHCKKKYAATWYQWCKNFGFAVQYQAGQKTADRAAHRDGCWILLKTRFSKLTALNAWCCSFANKHGYIETMPDKTVDPSRGYPLLCTRTENCRILDTVPLSYYIQGTATWWIMKAMIRVDEFFGRLNRGEKFAGKTWPGGYYLVMQVHDELDVDMPAGPTPKDGEQPWTYNLPILREVARLMSLGGDDVGVPTPIGVEYHTEHWGEGVTIKL